MKKTHTILNYRVIIKKETYRNGKPVYTAYSPTLDVSDYGDTIEQVLESIKDGIRLKIDYLSEKGQEIPLDDIENQIIASISSPQTNT